MSKRAYLWILQVNDGDGWVDVLTHTSLTVVSDALTQHQATQRGQCRVIQEQELAS